MSTLAVGTIKSATTSPPSIVNSADVQIGTFCRAWVNFNGTGTVAIRAGFNVSSITDNGTGDYTVNFTNAMQNSNYSTTATALRLSTDSANRAKTVQVGSSSLLTYSSAITTSSVRVQAIAESSGYNQTDDITGVFVSVFL